MTIETSPFVETEHFSTDESGECEARLLKQRKRRRTQLALLALMLLATTTFGWSVALFQTGRATGLVDTTASVVLTPLGNAIREYSPFVFFAGAFVILLSNLSTLRSRKVKGLLPALAGVLLLYFANASATQNITSTLTFLALVVAIAVAVWSIGLRVDDLVVLGRIGFSIAVVSLVMAATTDKAWIPAGETSKGIFFEDALAGFFPQMNPLGMSMAITLPFVFMFEKWRMRVIGFVAIASTLLLAASRTAIIAVGVGLAIAALLRVVNPRSRVFFGYVSVILTLAVSIIVPIVAEPAAFTGRGDIWRASFKAISEHPLWGNGPGAYMYGGQVTSILGVAHWHGHNMWITFMVIAGIFGLAALVLFWLPAMHVSFRIAQENILAPAVAIMTSFALGIAEVQIRPSEFDGVAWVSWLVLFAVATLVRTPRQAVSEE